MTTLLIITLVLALLLAAGKVFVVKARRRPIKRNERLTVGEPLSINEQMARLLK